MPGRVLVVDDIAPNVKLLEAKLTSEYYDVITADNGLTALELARSQAPDLILLDVMMPGLDGFKVCEKLKEDPMTAHIPVIMVTALSDTADRVRGLQAGADDFLSKPVRDVPLFARVRSLIRLKSLMDAWRVREEASARLGLPLTAVSGSADGTHGRILLVEDNPLDSEALKATLAIDGHVTVVTDDPDRALARVSEESFDLGIVSLSLLRGDGLRLCSQIRSAVQESARSLPLLLVAEDDEDMNRIAKAMDLGVNDYVMRPIERQEMLARVRTQVRRRRYQNRLRQNFEESIAMATTDALTGVFNRRYLDAQLETLVKDADQNHKPLTIAFCDIDRFKNLNDTYGHGAGDEVLIEFAARIRRNLRNFDLLARMGGEEFIVVMPDTGPEIALKVAERLRSKIAGESFPVQGMDPLSITMSVGLATLRPGESDSAPLIKRADEAMYRAKQGGRNKVVADETAPSGD
jgi:two-component system cell cycle response regulator